MSIQSILAWLGLLAFVCWCLGAYNRLVHLRAAVGNAFALVDEAMVQAGTWLLDHAPAPIEMPSSALADGQTLDAAVDTAESKAEAKTPLDSTPRSDVWDSCSAATQQLNAAAAEVRRDPLNAEAAAALSAALIVFQQVLQRALDSDAVSTNSEGIISGESTILVDSVAKTRHDVMVDLAVQGFNHAVLAYNAGIHAFPANVLAMFLGFSAAACIQSAEQTT